MSVLLPNGHVVAGRYAIRDLLGVGGMGSVYEVEALDGDRVGARFAMKAPLPEVARDAVATQRFQREVDAMRLLDHPNLVRAHDQLVEDGTLYLVLELARGPTLAEEIERGPIQARRALVIARQILDGLEHAHDRGIVHRDLKPDNVILTQAGDPADSFDHIKVLDFGVVKLLDTAALVIGGDKLSRVGTTFGTPAYIAPEQALGYQVDGRADLYSLGVMIFEMLTGTLPFVDRDAKALMRMQVSTPAPWLVSRAPGARWLTTAVDALVMTALAKKPPARFASAAAMRDAVALAFESLQELLP